MSECNTCNGRRFVDYHGHDTVCADCSDNLTPMECAKIRIKELEKLNKAEQDAYHEISLRELNHCLRIEELEKLLVEACVLMHTAINVVSEQIKYKELIECDDYKFLNKPEIKAMLNKEGE